MKPQDLVAHIHEDLVIWDLEGETKEGVLAEIAGRLESKQKVYRGDIVLDLLKKREEIGTTAIGREYAIPHCRTIAVEKLTLVVAIKRQGVSFDSLDKKPTKLFFTIVAPPHDVQYLPLLGAVAELLKSARIRKKLAEVRDMKGLKKILLEDTSQ
jgi:mannitol/fructose-specific phosphotransferase system IIA component (Ntr-type)